MGNPLDEKHYGFFRGTVTQNNDPERRGRVKIAIPEFTSQHARDAGLGADVYCSRFVGGSNITSMLDAPTLQKFNEVLKWAEQAAPLIGGGTSGVFDAKGKAATGVRLFVNRWEKRVLRHRGSRFLQRRVYRHRRIRAGLIKGIKLVFVMYTIIL